jgi:hypothetical protein
MRRTVRHRLRFLTGLYGPVQAGVNDLAATPDRLRLFDLDKGGAGVAEREEKLGILAQASSAVAPHRCWNQSPNPRSGSVLESSSVPLGRRGQVSDPGHGAVAEPGAHRGSGRTVLTRALFSFFHTARTEQRSWACWR